MPQTIFASTGKRQGSRCSVDPEVRPQGTHCCNSCLNTDSVPVLCCPTQNWQPISLAVDLWNQQEPPIQFAVLEQGQTLIRQPGMQANPPSPSVPFQNPIIFIRVTRLASASCPDRPSTPPGYAGTCARSSEFRLQEVSDPDTPAGSGGPMTGNSDEACS